MAILKEEKLSFQELTEEEKQKRGILGRLYGPCADVIHATRNGRNYSEELWEKVFNDPLVLEMIEKGGIPGELDHPVDRQEICSEKIAIMMPELPKKNDKGQLVAYFDILDTPNGRIAYQLAKYGFQLGVSSRGSGDVYEDYDGNESVDPETYTFNCFDLVLCPSVKTARLTLQESLQKDNNFKKSINDALEGASEEDRKIMVESLQKLKIDYKLKKANNNIIVESVAQTNLNKEAEDNGAYLVGELQRTIKKNKELTESLASVQEKLSVCYAKEAKYEALIEKYKSQNSSDENVESLRSEVKLLTEQLKEKSILIEKLSTRFSKLSESNLKIKKESESLTESLKNINDDKSLLNKRISTLNECLKEERQKSQVLAESLEENKKNLALKSKEYSSKLTKANSLIEHYKNIAQTTINKYIDSKAKFLGVSSNDIKSHLNESYTFEDIDRVCENLQGYQITASKLPFTLQKINNGKASIKVTESIEPIRPKGRFDDEVDDSLLRMAGLD